MIRLDERTGVIAGYAATPIDHEGRNRSANRAEEQRRGAIGVTVHGRRVGKAECRRRSTKDQSRMMRKGGNWKINKKMEK
jgi:hypothetical protein